ncbi:UDP-N-acetylglucosamine 2-epimerase [Piscinibacter sp. XHJ-5]|uniref:UDP-N-acetylglucosamine 2-epimerase n=1 Tax=Piscinibacter sp. XHJ-5 TaxID=3037797 RepID=UPI002452DABD|nr:UDP-N-acetylglucosamine 2-epimerase [Piscinibacter sp. XHJ-5]
MYESRFGITGPPFQLSPDPSFYFDSRGHHRALAELRRGLGEDAGFIVVSGEIGAGKTTLVRTLLEEIDPGVLSVAHVVSTQLNAQELLGATLIGFGLPVDDSTTEHLVSHLLRFLVKLDKEARRAVLIVDEAQNLHRDAFDQLVAIATRRGPRRLPFQVCLVGQPELRELIEAPDLAGLRSLVSVSCHLGPIDLEETGAYIEHRLRKVGWSGSPSFEPGAFEEIHRWTNGIPRRINLLCNRLMLSRFLASETTIDVPTVATTARDLRAEIGEPGDEPPPLALAGAGAPPRSAARAPKLQTPLVAPMEPGPLLCVVAGRADHVKAAALMRALAGRPDLPAAKLVRVHNDDALELSSALFSGLDVGKGLISLGIAPGPSDTRSPELMNVFEFVVDHVLPRAVIVFDGSEAALACATVAQAKDVPIVHIGAGLRADEGAQSATRQATDRLADLLYTTDAQASETLAREGIEPERVHCVGNLLMDGMQIAMRSLMSATLSRVGMHPAEPIIADRSGYALVVLTQPVNIGERQSLIDLLAMLRDVSRDVPLVWPMTPRIEGQLRKFRLDISDERITCLPPQSYPDYVALLRGATCLLTDSWNAQEESTALGVPCLTLGAFPERAITVSIGSNVAVGRNRTLVTRAVWDCMFNGGKRGRVPELWDGKTGARIAGYLGAWLSVAPTDRRAQA